MSYETDWKNIDFERESNLKLKLLEEYDFETLFLEIETSIEHINELSVMLHVREILINKVQSALEITLNNLDSIVKKANERRMEE